MTRPRKIVVGDRQAFCGTDGCRVFSWNIYDDPARFKAQATVVDLDLPSTPPAPT